MIGLSLSLSLSMSHRRCRRYDLVGIGFLLLLLVVVTSDLSLLVSSQEVDENITDTGTDTDTDSIINININDMLNTNANANNEADENNNITDTGTVTVTVTDTDTVTDTENINTPVDIINTDTDTNTDTIIVKNNNTNNCFEVTPSTSSGGGCTDSICENSICENIDSFCCTGKWDDNCIKHATEQASGSDGGVCLNDWPIQSNDCFSVDKFGRSGCTDTDTDNTEGSCELLVCDSRPECCTGPYDQDCVELALKKCDLPTATNQCLVKSDLPGCDNTKCLVSICSQHDESCCTTAYGPQCVELARNDTKNCAPTSSLNTCSEESIYGGCNDRRCQALVCSVKEGCCNSELGIGKFDKNCVMVAESLCQPTILKKVTDEGEVCPYGMICDYDFMSNCTELATQYIEVFNQGNVFGGIYCGNIEKDGIENCPRGSYCPDPETMFPCPAGYYCPYKTQYPTIDCPQCKEGATQRTQDMYGYIVLAIIVALVVVYIGWGLLQRYNTKLADRVHDLEKRFNVKKIQQKGIKNQEQQQKQVLEKLRPKLELIGLRLAKKEGVKRHDSRSSGIEFHGEDIKFDAKRLFDVLDADGSGDVTFDELNIILGLSEVELQEFIRRMNEMADMADNASVTRPVFAKYFLQALTDSSNLSISYEEAESIFDEMASIAGGGDKKLNEIDMKKFYTSSMSDFLSDSEIFELIKEFKALKAEAMVTTAAGEDQTSANTNGRTSLAALRMNRRGSSNSFDMSDINPTRRRGSLWSSSGGQRGFVQVPTSKAPMMIGRELFIKNYPQLLMDIMLKGHEDGDNADDNTDMMESRGVDLCFTDLSLSIKLGKKKVDVVNKVTGRVRAKTMTALMGGSGAGKTSLLNALCGRAHYGETTGTVYLNGHETSIEQHTDCIGFVPQDDTVYAELTVRENLIFSGKFRLPKGTTDEEIAELADETIANLGLSRVANSPVGDVRRRGVSGGEKKRVNIGLELMAMPSILFLDEPTSGLDASSALLVMKSLNHLVEKDGVTVVSVIHQPRKFIYDLFDSLILLGVGGQLIYHGPTEGAEPYFNRRNYLLPLGESVADWLIDISSGRLEPENQVAENRKESVMTHKTVNRVGTKELSIMPSHQESTEERKDESVETKAIARDSVDEIKDFFESDGGVSAAGLNSAGRVVTDGNCVGKKGVTTGKVVQALEEAKNRRAWLCSEWLKHFDNLCAEELDLYRHPEQYDLPIDTEKPAFWYQFANQLRRAMIVAWRDRFSKIISCTIIVGAVIFITAMDGATTVSVDKNPVTPYEILVRPTRDDFPSIYEQLFSYSNSKQLQYPMKVGIILCIIVGLSATNTLTSKRMEFFREAASGYNLNAYFFAINIISTFEHSAQVIIAAFFASWIRNPIASNASYYVHFLLLAWLTVAWAMLLPMICPADSVVLIAGFFFAFCGLVFSGAFAPIEYKTIYEDGGFSEILAGWISPTRFFFEALAVGEYRCLPEQSGFTIEKSSLNREANSTMMYSAGFAGHDYNAVRLSCDGWYWSVVPVILIGITVRYLAIGAMHTFFRGQQSKKPLFHVMKRDWRVAAITVIFCFGFVILFSVTTWLFIRDIPFEEAVPLTDFQFMEQMGFFS